MDRDPCAARCQPCLAVVVRWLTVAAVNWCLAAPLQSGERGLGGWQPSGPPSQMGHPLIGDDVRGGGGVRHGAYLIPCDTCGPESLRDPASPQAPDQNCPRPVRSTYYGIRYPRTKPACGPHQSMPQLLGSAASFRRYMLYVFTYLCLLGPHRLTYSSV